MSLLVAVVITLGPARHMIPFAYIAVVDPSMRRLTGTALDPMPIDLVTPQHVVPPQLQHHPLCLRSARKRNLARSPAFFISSKLFIIVHKTSYSCLYMDELESLIYKIPATLSRRTHTIHLINSLFCRFSRISSCGSGINSCSLGINSCRSGINAPTRTGFCHYFSSMKYPCFL